MSLARLASFVHKWLALLVGIQIVFWVVSGLFFTIFPIQQIRSENLIRPAQTKPSIPQPCRHWRAYGKPRGAADKAHDRDAPLAKSSLPNLLTSRRSSSMPPRFSASHR